MVMAPSPRWYRLVDQQGVPHPVLDDLYDSLDAAWAEAQSWWLTNVSTEPVGIGVEVSTASGCWRTLRPPAESAFKMVSADTKKGAVAPFHSPIGS